MGLCRALWSCIETAIWTFNPLVPIEIHYMEKNPGMFSSENLISFRLKKERHERLGWHGGKWVNCQEILILEWTNPLKKQDYSIFVCYNFYVKSLPVKSVPNLCFNQLQCFRRQTARQLPWFLEPRANFTKQGKLARERNSKKKSKISAGDLLKTCKLYNTDATSHLHIDQCNIPSAVNLA